MNFINMISAMKVSIQGGAWSEVGKKIENVLLFTLFKYLQIPDENFILVSKDIQKNVGMDRETDGILYNNKKKPYRIELKLLGIGNPEIADEGLARDIQLFLVDDLTDMMVKQFKKKGINVILFKNKKIFEEMYNFCRTNTISAKKPKSKITLKKICKFVDTEQKQPLDLELLRKLNSL